MRTITDFSSNYDGDPIRYFNFGDLDNGNENLVFHYGISSANSNVDNDKFNIFLDLEEPSSSLHLYPREFENKFSLVLSICPYYTEFVNRRFSQNSAKRECVFFPFNRKDIPSHGEKINEVIYTGQMNGTGIEEILEILSHFKNRVVSFGPNRFSTDVNVSYHQKLNLVSQSKISIIHNLIFPQSAHIEEIKKSDLYKENGAFSHLEDFIYPQLKSRTFEAAFCKTLMLVQKDPWNLIELYFKPGKDFIYFDGKDDLRLKINQILENYSEYQEMIENAFEKAINNYTTEDFYNQYILKYEK